MRRAGRFRAAVGVDRLISRRLPARPPADQEAQTVGAGTVASSGSSTPSPRTVCGSFEVGGGAGAADSELCGEGGLSGLSRECRYLFNGAKARGARGRRRSPVVRRRGELPLSSLSGTARAGDHVIPVDLDRELSSLLPGEVRACGPDLRIEPRGRERGHHVGHVGLQVRVGRMSGRPVDPSRFRAGGTVRSADTYHLGDR